MSRLGEAMRGLPRPTLPARILPIRKIRCSFCDKSQNDVQKVIAGPNGVYICDECIELCNEIIDEESKWEDQSV